MAKIPVISRLVVEEFPEQQKWIGKLLNPINQFMAASAYALTRHLTFGDNLLGQEQILDFTYNGSQTFPLNFLITMNSTPHALYVVQATENVNTPVALLAAWTINQNSQVHITDISKISQGVASSLVQGARYQIRVRITP